VVGSLVRGSTRAQTSYECLRRSTTKWLRHRGGGNVKKKRARTKTVVAELAARFPKCFAVPDGRRWPLKIGIDADLM
jgi:ProQ/FINO family